MDLRRVRWFLLVLLLIAALGTAGCVWLFAGLPSTENLPDRLNAPSVRITDRDGRVLYEVLGEQGGRHAVVPLEDIPLDLREATIAAEDRSFYSNPGVDAGGVLRALWINLRASLAHNQVETLSGGSTITQQVARNLLLSQEERVQRSLRRKLREAVLAWQLTRRYSKDEILALYLNQIYYGGLAYGVEAAAQTFFGKPASQLDLAESALLAGLPQSPGAYNPFSNPDNAGARQQVVLGLMQKAGFISAEERALAERETLAFAATPYPMEAPHFVMMVRAELDRMYMPEQIYQQGGLVVRTSLDLNWQRHAERAVRRHLAELARDDGGLGHNVNNAALVALDPQNGQILALVGSPDYFDAANGGAINMALAPRQPGSALKPILYAAALDPDRRDEVGASIQPWTAATMLLDVSTSFVTNDGKAYTPANYDLLEHGPVLLREALASSLNIPAVVTLDFVGLDGLFEQSAKMGITTLKDPAQYDLSLALGGGAVRLLELTAAYGAFANGGYRVDPVSILEIRDPQGNLLFTAPAAQRTRVLDERVAWLISDILDDNDARRIGFGPNSALRIDRPAAVKTGTTSNFHDNWTVGYTPELAVGVWVGNSSYEPMREVNGLTGAAPIWHQFIRTVLTGQPRREFHRPEGLIREQVCALSGLLVTPACPYRRWEWFIEGTQPTQRDHFYREVQIDAATGLLATPDTPPERRITKTVLDLPIQAQKWARRADLLLMDDLRAASGADEGWVAASPLYMASPASGGTYRLTTAIAPSAQRICLEALGEKGLSQVSLWIDGHLLAEFEQSPFRVCWPIEVGQHEAWSEGVRQGGERVTSERVKFVVESEGQPPDQD